MLLGVDCSHWQGVIDWPKVKDAGIQFVYVKASEGSGFVDSRFAANWAGAKAVGLPRGAYHFWRRAYDGAAQAAHFLRTVGADVPELHYVVDVEDTAAPKDAAGNQASVDKMLGGLAGKKVMIYSARWYWEPWMGGTSKYSALPFWVADYRVVSAPLMSGWADWLIWQYTSSGSVPGISGGVDTNRAKDSLLGSTSGIPDVRPEINEAKRHLDEVVRTLYG